MSASLNDSVSRSCIASGTILTMNILSQYCNSHAVITVCALVGMGLVFSNNARAEDNIVQSLADTKFVSKKQRYLLAKSEAVPVPQEVKKSSAPNGDVWRKLLDRRINKRPTNPVNIYNKWTHEVLVFEAGHVQQPTDTQIGNFLRCHFTNQPTQMDPRLFPVLLKAAKRFRARRIEVVSGFRDPKYNLSLRKKGRQVARGSEHTLGHAVDFRIPGIGIKRLHSWARSLRLGGVGFYRHSGFIHVDVGKVRYWNGT